MAAPAPSPVAVLAADPAAWTACVPQLADVSQIVSRVDDAPPGAALIVDLPTPADRLAAVTRATAPGAALVAVVVIAPDAEGDALRAAGATLVTSSPHAAVAQAVAAGAAALLHDGPAQSLTAARLQLGLAARAHDAARPELDAVDEELGAVARDLARAVEVLRALRGTNE